MEKENPQNKNEVFEIKNIIEEIKDSIESGSVYLVK